MEELGLRQGHLALVCLFMSHRANQHRRPGHRTRTPAPCVADAFPLMLSVSPLYQYALVLAPSLALNGISL